MSKVAKAGFEFTQTYFDITKGAAKCCFGWYKDTFYVSVLQI